MNPENAKPEALSLEAEHCIPNASPHFQTELAAQLAALVPEAVADGEIDIEKLRQLLGQDAATGAERFGLFWPGKGQAIRAAQLPSTATLQPVPEQSKNWDETQNVFIEGDNLEVLKTLQRHYHGKVKLIYIDPPYNTGKDFVYRDKYQEGLQTYLEWTQQVNSEGQKTSPNSESAGRYHSNWLNMMYPRLKLARNLLAEDGVIFISIDDNEAAHLKVLCDEVFGSQNFICALAVKRSANGLGSKEGFASNHDSIFVYQRNSLKKAFFGVKPDKAYLSKFDTHDSFGSYKIDGLFRKKGQSASREDSPGCYYPVFFDPSTGEVALESKRGDWLTTYPKLPNGTDGRWIWSRDFAKDKTHRLKASSKGTIYVKDYLTEGQRVKPRSILEKNSYLTERATNEIIDLFGKKVFDTPKPINLLKDLFDNATRDDSLILDFFAGSATTAQAVMQLNAEDGGQRRFILVQLPEPTPADSEARKAGFATIADISRRRIELAGEKIKTEMGDKAAGLDVGFRAYKLADTQFAKWRVSSDSTPEALQQSLLAQRNGADDAASSAALLTEVLLKMGYALSERSSSRTIASLPWQQVGQAGGAMPPLLAYMDEHQPPTLEQLRAAIDTAAAEAMRVVLLEDALAGDDALKTNALEYAKAHGVELKTA